MQASSVEVSIPNISFPHLHQTCNYVSLFKMHPCWQFKSMDVRAHVTHWSTKNLQMEFGSTDFATWIDARSLQGRTLLLCHSLGNCSDCFHHSSFLHKNRHLKRNNVTMNNSKNKPFITPHYLPANNWASMLFIQEGRALHYCQTTRDNYLPISL